MTRVSVQGFKSLGGHFACFFPVLYTVGLQATFWNMDSNVWAILVVWPGKAAVDSLVDRLSKGGKPKFKYFSS